MTKLLANLFDSEFAHTIEDGYLTSSYMVKPKIMNYSIKNLEWEGVTLFTERNLHLAPSVKSDIKVAWLLEAPGIFPWSVDTVVHMEDHFDLILTTIPSLLSRGGKYRKVTIGACRIPEEAWDPFPEKPKMCSIIASGKAQLEGHRLRHTVIRTLDGFDVWGNGYKRFDSKETALRDYRFSVCIMNMISENYFTEVLLDCFFVGTIPIFWGCANIGEFFDKEGIISFTTVEELKEIMGSLTEELYLSKAKAIQNNFDLVHSHMSTDDNVAAAILKEFPHLACNL